MIAFWRPENKGDPYPYLGQWHLCRLKVTEEVVEELPEEIKNMNVYKEKKECFRLLYHEYNTSEMFMMAFKAALMGDNERIRLILNEHRPAAQKKLGSQVRPWDEDVWNRYKLEIVTIGNYLKFTQNRDLKPLLLQTGTAELVEGSPLDTVWGVGLRFDDPLIEDKRNWRGQNLLGQALMHARSMIAAESAQQS